MDRTRNVPDATVICSDINKLTDVAKSAIDHALEVLKLLPTPIPIDSKVYKSLEAIQGVPLESSSTKNNSEVGIQVDFINRGPETIIEEANIFDSYEVISITPDKQLITENPLKIEITEAKEDVTKAMQIQEDTTIEPKLIETLAELKYSEEFKMELKQLEDKVNLLDKCAILLSKVKSEQETDIAIDKETFSMKSCKSTLKLLKREECSETNDDTCLLSTGLNKMPDESVVIPNETENTKDINESLVSVTEVLPDITHVADTVIKETMINIKVNPQKVPGMMTNEEKTNPIPNRNYTSIKDSMLDSVKPINYKLIQVHKYDENINKCLKIAEKAMAEHNYDKAKHVIDMAIRKAESHIELIATEAMEKVESLHNQAHTQSKRKLFDDASELTTKIKKAAKISTTGTIQEEIIQAKNNDSENFMNMNTTDSDTHKVDEALGLIKQARIEIKLAEKYMKDNNLKKVEHFLKKSIHIAPSTEAKETLEENEKKDRQKCVIV